MVSSSLLFSVPRTCLTPRTILADGADSSIAWSFLLIALDRSVASPVTPLPTSRALPFHHLVRISSFFTAKPTLKGWLSPIPSPVPFCTATNSIPRASCSRTPTPRSSGLPNTDSSPHIFQHPLIACPHRDQLPISSLICHPQQQMNNPHTLLPYLLSTNRVCRRLPSLPQRPHHPTASESASSRLPLFLLLLRPWLLPCDCPGDTFLSLLASRTRPARNHGPKACDSLSASSSGQCRAECPIRPHTE